MFIPFLGNVDWWQFGWMTTGFFLVLWLMKGRKKERRYYVSKIPTELIIERDA